MEKQKSGVSEGRRQPMDARGWKRDETAYYSIVSDFKYVNIE